jgi:hypothetical protein
MDNKEFLATVEKLQNQFKKRVEAVKAEYRVKIQELIKSVEAERISKLRKELDA